MALKIHEGTKPSVVHIGDLALPCAVLENGTRVLSHRGIAKVLGGRRGGARDKDAGAQLPVFLAASKLKPYISKDLALALSEPPIYDNPYGGGVIYGVKATFLPDLCDVWLKARNDGELTAHQKKVAAKAEVIVRGLARMGIEALIDEATDYQFIRERNALQKILDKYVSEEARPWVKTFDDEFYRLIFKLNGWPYSPSSVKRPSVIGRWTNDIYNRLAPGIKQELHRIVRRNAEGKPIEKLHQHFTDEGRPLLRDHLAGVMALMRASSNWSNFRRLLQRSFPKPDMTMEMNLTNKDGEPL